MKTVGVVSRRRFFALSVAVSLFSIIALPGISSADSVGDVGAWSTGTSLNTATTTAGAVTYNSFVYMLAGRDNSLNALNAVEYAPLNANGSLGSWTTSPNNLPGAMWRPAVTEYNGYLYVLGGLTNGGPVNTVYYAKIANDGSVGTWATGATLSDAEHSMAIAAYNGYMYLFGGADAGGNVSTVYSAAINVNGSLGSWTTTTALPQAERRQHAVVYGGYVYVVGGLAGSNSTAIYSAALNGGTVGTWNTLSTVLPSAMIDFSVAENNGYIYLTGGNNGSYLSSVYYAPLSSGGQMGNWTQSANSLPGVEEGLSAVTYNNFLYVLGGDNSGSAALTGVYYAAIQMPSAPTNNSTPASDPTLTDTGVNTAAIQLAAGVLLLLAAVVFTRRLTTPRS